MAAGARVREPEEGEAMAQDEGEMDKVVPLRAPKCPMCGKPRVERYRPFCSRRCADLDLGKWLNEDYRIPAEEGAELGDDEFEET